MPKYLYKCKWCGSEVYQTHRMGFTGTFICPGCRKPMTKKPQGIGVIWNGNKPSDGGVTDLVKQMINEAPYKIEESKK